MKLKDLRRQTLIRKGDILAVAKTLKLFLTDSRHVDSQRSRPQPTFNSTPSLRHLIEQPRRKESFQKHQICRKRNTSVKARKCVYQQRDLSMRVASGHITYLLCQHKSLCSGRVHFVSKRLFCFEPGPIFFVAEYTSLFFCTLIVKLINCIVRST